MIWIISNKITDFDFRATFDASSLVQMVFKAHIDTKSPVRIVTVIIMKPITIGVVVTLLLGPFQCTVFIRADIGR